MEPQIANVLSKYFAAGGDATEMIHMLADNYRADAQMINITADLMVLAGIKSEDVKAMIESNVRNMFLRIYDPTKVEQILLEEGELPEWLKALIGHSAWRLMIYELSENFPGCLLMSFLIKLISDAGYHNEMIALPKIHQQIEVFSKVIRSSIDKILSQPENMQENIEECAKMVCLSQHTYVYSQVAINSAGQELSNGKSAMIVKRLSQELTKYALKHNRNVTAVTMALDGSRDYPLINEGMSAMLTRNALNPSDILLMYKSYTGPSPPPVELLRNPQFLELLVEAIFKCPSKMNPEYKAKYIYLLAYGASVIDTSEEKRVESKDELEKTLEAIEKAHCICSMRKTGYADLLPEMSTLFECIRFPVVGLGVIKWIDKIVSDPSYFKLNTAIRPIHLAILDEVAENHATFHQEILTLLINLFETVQSEMELEQLEIRKMLLDHIVFLLAEGCVVPVLKYIKLCSQRQDTDIYLIRYFVTEVLTLVNQPYSSEFVEHFLPLVENEVITGAIRSDGDDDLVSEFIGKF